ncbi:MAG TPA: right-handed parallel beta-helix repeat-containing protein [Thiobacillus sp.]|nr:right-handed parallel beta-helix repeat-containing protein [Thiobacillus sp.]
MTATFKDTWQVNEFGHVAAHNQLARRLNQGIDASDFGVGPLASAATNHAGIGLAIDKAASRNGGTVHLPPGILYVSAPIDIPSSVSLVGAGQRATRLVPSAPLSAMVRMVGTAESYRSGCRVEALTLECNERCEYGIEVDYASDTNEISRVAVRQALTAGIILHDWHCWGNLIDRCLIEYNGRGVKLGIAANMTGILNTIIQYNTGAGLWMVEATSVLCRLVRFQWNGQGGAEQQAVEIAGGHTVTLDTCYWEANGRGGGVDVNVHAGPYNPVNGLVLVGPYFNGSSDNPPAGALHAVATDATLVGIQGGKSNLHLGTTFAETNGGTVETLWFTSIDAAGLR